MFQFPKGGWRQTKKGSFSPIGGNTVWNRDGGELVVIPSGTHAGRWVLCGGWYTGTIGEDGSQANNLTWPETTRTPQTYGYVTNQILISDDDGATWSIGKAHDADAAAGSSPTIWMPSHYVPTFLHTYSGTTYIYRIGGDQYSNAQCGRVWRTPISDGGASGWVQVTQDATYPLPWGGSIGMWVGRAVSFNSAIYIFGGHENELTATKASKKLYKSTDGGATWSEITTVPSGLAKRGACGMCVHGGNLYITCGEQFDNTSPVYFNDVWSMQSDDSTWSERVSNGHAQFSKRVYARLESAGGRLWLFGGATPTSNSSTDERTTAAYGDSENLKSAYYSLDDGETWRRAADLAWDGSHADGMFSDGTRIYRVSGNRFDHDAYIIHK